MNIMGREQVGAFTPDNLIAGNRHPVDVCHIIIKAGEVLKRGSLLEEDGAEAGKFVLRGTQPEAKAAYILADDVNASEDDMTALAYRTGEFAENALIVKEGYAVTDADKKALRDAGIFLAGIMM